MALQLRWIRDPGRQYDRVGQRQVSAAPERGYRWVGRQGGAIDRIALVMMARDEEDIVLENLSWHAYLGFRRFLVADNLSRDATRRCLATFRADWPDAELLIVDDPIEAYIQERKTEGLLRMAHALWDLDWVFPIDADEFLCAQHDLADSLDRLRAAAANVCMIPSLDYVPVRAGDAAADTPTPFYRRLVHHLPVRNPRGAKVAFEPHGLRAIEIGNHRVHLDRRVHLQSGVDMGLVYRHYSVRSPAQLRNKVILGGQALLKAGHDPLVGVHWRERYRRYLDEGEGAIAALYDELSIDAAEGIHFPFDPGVALRGARGKPA